MTLMCICDLCMSGRCIKSMLKAVTAAGGLLPTMHATWTISTFLTSGANVPSCAFSTACQDVVNRSTA